SWRPLHRSRFEGHHGAIYGSHMPATKTTVYLDRGDYERLKLIARRRRESPAALLPDAVREYADRHDVQRVPPSVGAGRRGKGKLSEGAEELLKGMGRRR